MTEVIAHQPDDDIQEHQDDVARRDADAEREVLAGLMASPEFRRHYRGRLHADRFGGYLHSRIFRAINDADGRGELDPDATIASAAVRPVLDALLRAQASNDGDELGAALRIRTGGHTPQELSNYLIRVADYAPFTRSQMNTAVRSMESAHARRVMRATGHRLASAAEGLTGHTLDDLRSAAIGITEELTTATTAGLDDAQARVADRWDEFVADIGARDDSDRIKLGLIDLDAVVRLRPGHMLMLGARTSIGKTAVGLTFARGAAKQGAYVVYLSFEVTQVECMERIASAEAGVPYSKIQNGDLADVELQRVQNAVANIPQHLYVPNSPRRDLDQVVSTIYRTAAAAQAEGIHPVVFVDYIQQVRFPGNRSNRQEIMTEISNSIQEAAQDSGCAVVCCAQLNRQADHREDKKPQLSDLRDSGALEQDAHVAVLLHRPDFYDRWDPRMGEMDLIVAKNRSGPTKTITTAHQLHLQRVVDMAPAFAQDTDGASSSTTSAGTHGSAPAQAGPRVCPGCRDA
ncbi:DnaB-like helicase C-terminal domain-containing protein, partial [Saccharopolyspora sp. NPDC000359]|uniref:replicative DNA helicase n=1 Tax=Saccharopolyspora sp. NPDC000359 TaxID=3154251 RepID=UPI00332D9BF1